VSEEAVSVPLSEYTGLLKEVEQLKREKADLQHEIDTGDPMADQRIASLTKKVAWLKLWREAGIKLLDALILTCSKEDYDATFAEGGDELNEAYRNLRALLHTEKESGK
jgi:hypothetical protein